MDTGASIFFLKRAYFGIKKCCQLLNGIQIYFVFYQQFLCSLLRQNNICCNPKAFNLEVGFIFQVEERFFFF